MDISQGVILLMISVGFASRFTKITSHHRSIVILGTANAIQCYSCFGICSNPFNKTHPNVQIHHSPTGWCMVSDLDSI